MKLRFLWPAMTLAVSFGCLDDTQLVAQSEANIRKENGGMNGSSDFCVRAGTCGSGEGDRDSNAPCDPGLICGNDIGARFDMPGNFDVCVPAHCVNGTQDVDETGTDCGGPTCGVCTTGGCVGVNGD